jgi:hypothetical protein
MKSSEIIASVREGVFTHSGPKADMNAEMNLPLENPSPQKSPLTVTGSVGLF